MIRAEATTAVTDLLLACLSWWGAWWLRRTTPGGYLQRIWRVALVTFGLAAFLGAVAHGLPWSPGTLDLLWQPLYLILGVAVALFVAAALAALRGERAARSVMPYLLAAAGAFYLLTRMTGGDFRVFVAYEGAGLLFALGTHLRLARRWAGAGAVAAGLAISLAAGVVQAVDTISLRLVWTFDHNGVYHLVQVVGLGVLLAGLRRLLATPRAAAA